MPAKPRWGTDDDGNEIQPPATGLVFNPETGMAEPPAASPPPAEKPAEKPAARPKAQDKEP